MHRIARTGLCLLAILTSALAACERGPAPASRPANTEAVDRVQLPPEKPAYSFAPGLSEQHPAVVAFMRHFLETCMAGDYAGYRRLIARATEPESRARFERVLNTLRKLRVESIELIELKQLPPPVYLVVSEAEFVLDEKAARHRAPGPRRVAVLVVQEEREYRLILAPPELQPDKDADQDTATSATSTAPSYPWDQDGDH